MDNLDCFKLMILECSLVSYFLDQYLIHRAALGPRQGE